MNVPGIDKFTESLANSLDKPPYHVFIFMSGIFVLVALISQWNFEPIWIFFIYAVAGTIWRYAERDALSVSKSLASQKLKLTSLVIYHIGNIILFIILLRYLNFI